MQALPLGPSQGVLQTEHLKYVNEKEIYTVRNKAQIKFIIKNMASLGLLESLARHPGNTYLNQTELWNQSFFQKDKIWRHGSIN